MTFHKCCCQLFDTEFVVFSDWDHVFRITHPDEQPVSREHIWVSSRLQADNLYYGMVLSFARKQQENSKF